MSRGHDLIEPYELTRIELIEADTKLPQARKKFRLDISVSMEYESTRYYLQTEGDTPMDCIVNALVRSWLYVPIRLAYSDHFGNLPSTFNNESCRWVVYNEAYAA